MKVDQVGDELGVVVIGRNEGERLRRCLESVRGLAVVVYVDSDSSDGSVAGPLAGSNRGLLTSRAVRGGGARNEGLSGSRAAPGVPRVQFVDGDCESSRAGSAGASASTNGPTWASSAAGAASDFPECSVYNRLADLEWNGRSARSGLRRRRHDPRRGVPAAAASNPSVIAAEDDELCLRIRGGGRSCGSMPRWPCTTWR